MARKRVETIYADQVREGGGFVAIATRPGTYGKGPRVVGWFESRESLCFAFQNPPAATYRIRVLDGRTNKPFCTVRARRGA